MRVVELYRMVVRKAFEICTMCLHELVYKLADRSRREKVLLPDTQNLPFFRIVCGI